MSAHFDWEHELSSDERAQIKRAVTSYTRHRKHDSPASLDSLYEHVLADFECNDEKLHTDHHAAIRDAVSHYAEDED